MSITDQAPTVLLVNGPNLNLLGVREPGTYGDASLDDIVRDVTDRAASGSPALRVLAFQSNHEGELIDFIHRHGPSVAGMIINAGALTHTSVALRDAITGVNLSTIEVHISNIHRRETFRHHSYLADVTVGQIVGLGTYGYSLALEWFRNTMSIEENL